MESIDLLIACIHKLGGNDLESREANTVDFQLRDIPTFAYVQDGRPPAMSASPHISSGHELRRCVEPR